MLQAVLSLIRRKLVGVKDEKWQPIKGRNLDGTSWVKSMNLYHNGGHFYFSYTSTVVE